MEIFVIVALIIILLAIWIMSARRKLAVMNENTNNAMNQIGVQLSSCFDVLASLLDLAGEYAADESRTLAVSVKARRGDITAGSAPEDVTRQSGVISETVERIDALAAGCPEFKADTNYARYMDAVACYDRMILTSCLIYNDSVTKLNQSLRMFPTSLIAGMLGFHRRGRV